MNSPAYDLHSPFSSTASTASSFPTDGSPLSESNFEHIHPDSFVYPVFSSHGDLGHPYPVDYPDCHPIMANWSPDAKKQEIHHIYQIPRSQNLYSAYHDVKSAPYIPPPIPPPHRQLQLQQNIHSPQPSHPLQQHQPHQSPAAAAIFDIDEDWQSQAQPPSSHYSQSHLASYANTASPPRIKQEEMAGFPAIPGYSEQQLLHHQHQRSPYDSLNQPLPSQHLLQSHAHDPNANGGSYPTILSPLQTHSISPSHSHSHSQPPSVAAAAYYSHSPSFQQHQQPQHQHHRTQSHVSQQPRQPHQQAPQSFQSFSGGTVHPTELSPTTTTTESCSSVSPLSAYADLSAGVGVVNDGCDPRFVCHQQQSGGDLKWHDERRDSLVSLADSELSMHSSHGMVEIMGMDGMQMDGLTMAGVVVGGMPVMTDVVAVNEVRVEDGDAAGEEDAEGDEDWDHSEQPQGVQQGQGQFQIVHQQMEMEYMDEDHDHNHEDESEREAEGEAEDPRGEHDSQVQQSRHSDDEGEDEVTGESSEGEPEKEGEAEYDSELSESEEEEEDDDDPEFVPRTRRRPLRRQSTFPQVSASAVAGDETSYQTFAYSTIMGEGRSLRPRSSSVRYNPYPASYPESTGRYYSGEHDFNDQQDSRSGAYNERISGRRSSTSSLSSTNNPPRSASSLSSSSGLTTTTTTTTSRRRVRPSATLPVPVPVPNLTKKSRGRRVPTMSSLEDLRSAASGAGKKRQNALSVGGKTARMYLCDVEGCGKCFARGEHLKRHVRSIHTYEKPHKCLYPGCGKDFSRHDNLGQHMRVHKGYVQGGVTVAGSESTARSSSASSSGSARRKAPTQN